MLKLLTKKRRPEHSRTNIRLVVLDFEPESESPRGLVENTACWASPHVFDSLGVGLLNLLFLETPMWCWCCWSEDLTLRAYAFDKRSLHMWDTLSLKKLQWFLKLISPACNLQKLELWTKGENPDLSLVSIFYKVKRSRTTWNWSLSP